MITEQEYDVAVAILILLIGMLAVLIGDAAEIKLILRGQNGYKYCCNLLQNFLFHGIGWLIVLVMAMRLGSILFR
jgi:hypothetical protein